MARQTNPKAIIQSGLRQHQNAFRLALRDIGAHPIAHLLAILTIATALALPTGVFSLLSNLQNINQSWDQGKEINLYMQPNTSNQQLASIHKQLQAHPHIQKVRLISSHTAIENLEAATGLQNIKEILGNESLPPVFVINPTVLTHPKATPQGNTLETLEKELAALPHAKEVQLDKEWADQMQHTVSALQRFSALVSALFGLTVILVVSATMRMSVIERRAEIEVTKLVGGSNQYIQRPFLYTALFLALASSFIALLMVSLGLSTLAEPLSKLARIFSGELETGLRFPMSAGLTIFASVLSMLSAWVTVHFQLTSIEPR